MGVKQVQQGSNSISSPKTHAQTAQSPQRGSRASPPAPAYHRATPSARVTDGSRASSGSQEATSGIPRSSTRASPSPPSTEISTRMTSVRAATPARATTRARPSARGEPPSGTRPQASSRGSDASISAVPPPPLLGSSAGRQVTWHWAPGQTASDAPRVPAQGPAAAGPQPVPAAARGSGQQPSTRSPSRSTSPTRTTAATARGGWPP